MRTQSTSPASEKLYLFAYSFSLKLRRMTSNPSRSLCPTESNPPPIPTSLRCWLVDAIPCSVDALTVACALPSRTSSDCRLRQRRRHPSFIRVPVLCRSRALNIAGFRNLISTCFLCSLFAHVTRAVCRKEGRVPLQVFVTGFPSQLFVPVADVVFARHIRKSRSERWLNEEGEQLIFLFCYIGRTHRWDIALGNLWRFLRRLSSCCWNWSIEVIDWFRRFLVGLALIDWPWIYSLKPIDWLWCNRTY